MNLNEVLPIARPLVIFDCETTGPNPEVDRIVELGYTVFRPDGSVREWQGYINPGIPIPREATYGRGDEYPGHGITDEMVQGCRHCGRPQIEQHDGHEFHGWPTFAEIAPHLLKGFTGCDFGGYNIEGYDLPLTQAEFKRCGIEWSYAEAFIVDGLQIWKVGQKRTLSDASEFFLNESHKDAHHALDDVRKTVRVMVAQLTKFYQRFPRDIKALHELLWPSDPNWVDSKGKIIWNEAGVAVMNFGKKWKGLPITRMTRRDLLWVAEQATGMPLQVRQICRDAAAGRFPVRETKS